MTVSVVCRCFSVAVHARMSSDSDYVAESPAPSTVQAGQTPCTHISPVAAVEPMPPPNEHDSWSASRFPFAAEPAYESVAMPSPSSADQVADSPRPRLPADHPGVNELFALLAYGEVAAFYRLTDEARMAPDLRGRISMASMAAAEMGHYELLRNALERRGVDVVSAMSKYTSALENYHRLTTPSTWLEALVKTYVADALAADLYLEIADGLPDEVADVVRAALSETGHSQFVVAEVRAAVTASGKQRSRLALWSRRLLGEAITQAQLVLADHDELVDLVVSGSGGLSQLGAFFDRLQQTHDQRMRELGLS